MIPPQINIVTLVDVIGALSAGTLKGNMYISDNSRSQLTIGQGTATLSSAVQHTQVLNWHVWPIDVQTDIQISNITFYQQENSSSPEATPCAELKKYGAPSGDYWAGVVDIPKGLISSSPDSGIDSGIYYYQIEFDMGRKIMLMDEFASINVS